MELLNRFRCFFFWFWVNHFCLFRVHLILVYHSVILGRISGACSESWYRKLEFCVTSFWFYNHRLWWSSWHAMLALFLSYIFLVWIFSWHDLFLVRGTDASCVLYIICSEFITFEQVTLYFHCWYLFMPFCFAFALICFLLNLIVQLTSEFSLSCTDLCKVSAEDCDPVISQIVVLIA